jgi:hypothetical protein
MQVVVLISWQRAGSRAHHISLMCVLAIQCCTLLLLLLVIYDDAVGTGVGMYLQQA